MKTKWLLLSLPVFILTFAASAEKTVTLRGLVVAPGIKKAVIKAEDPTRHWSEELPLSEGQNLNGVTLTSIDASNATVNVVVDGEQRSLVFKQSDEAGSTVPSESAVGSSVRLNSVTLQTALLLYADVKERTVLAHPQLSSHTFSLVANPANNADAAAAFEKMFTEHSVAVIPDGEHFVMMLPFSLTNAVTPRAESLVKSDTLIPAQSINFWQAPISMALSTYGDFLGKKIVNPNDAPPRMTVTFRQTSPLSKQEISYAFETLFAWNGIRLVPEGTDLKVERIGGAK